MCDLNRVSGFLTAAKVAYVATLTMLGVAIINSASLFAAAANIPLMVAAIASTALSTGMYVAALAEVDRCMGEACAAELGPLRSSLIGLLATMATFTAALIALALVAAIPFAGAAAVGAFISFFIGFTALVAGGIELAFGSAVQAYNDCRSRAGTTTIATIVLILTYTAAAASAGFSIGGGIAGKIPWSVLFQW